MCLGTAQRRSGHGLDQKVSVPVDPTRTLILGATGHFGKRLCQRLAIDNRDTLILASRSIDSASTQVRELARHNPGLQLETARIDQLSGDLSAQLARCAPDIVIHTAGPYQELGYQVARSCIDIGAHYIDLADGRDFVTGITRLDREARDADVLVVSGASTLPGLSSAVRNEYRGRFSQLETIEICIAPAHQTPRGLGTVQAVLGYCGKPFDTLQDGAMRRTFGWQGLRPFRHPDLGWRLAADCDVPDLDLLAMDVDGVRTVRFQASLEAIWEQLGLYLMAGLTRLGLVKDWRKLAPALVSISGRLSRLGSCVGGMHIKMCGNDLDGKALQVEWFLTARQNHGPEIPGIPAAIIAKKLASRDMVLRGAMPCVGLITLADFAAEMRGLTSHGPRKYSMIDLYFSVKLLHILSSTILFGTGVGTAFFMYNAWTGGDRDYFSQVAQRVVLADWIFTTPAVAVQLATGIYLTWQSGIAFDSAWFVAVIALFMLIGCCWIPVLFIQYRVRDMLLCGASTDACRHLMRVWTALGCLALMFILLVFCLMIFKPGLGRLL
jgi:uncharacterized membrane protein